MTKRILIICGLSVTLLGLSVFARAEKKSATGKIQDVLKNYYIIADFSQKEEERPVSEELFWKYPFKLPPIEFPIAFDFDNMEKEFPKTTGQGRAIQHINRGRKLLFDGETKKAKDTWLAARSRFGEKWSHHRRNDYYIANAFLKLAHEALVAKKYDYQDPAVKTSLDNVITFFAWAYKAKKHIPDPVVDAGAPKAFYNMAAIYWQYNRPAEAYAAAELGLNFLRRTGRTEYRPQFHRFVAEAHIKNRTYLEAVQQLDISIRQDPDPEQASAMFARIGDIYFDLNNYELAAQSYDYGATIDEELSQVNQTQLILRGESLFWLGKFDEAQKLLHFGIHGATFRDVVSPLPFETKAYAALRFADAYLARKEYEKAKLEYYKIYHSYRGTAAGEVALIRQACLELPTYSGKNVMHARKDLESAKSQILPAPARELAWACQVASYAERERTAQMVDRVKQFYVSHPNSRFLRDLIEPVRETQADRIFSYFKENDPYGAISFFETNRNLLYKDLDDDLKRKLFVAYVDIFKSEKAAEFWSAAKQEAMTDTQRIRLAVAAAELAESGDKVWVKRNQQVADEWNKHSWSLPASESSLRNVLRVTAGRSGVPHLPWIAKIADHWAKNDETYFCNLKLPTMSRLVAEGVSDREALDAAIQGAIKQRMPALLKTDEGCALSLLDLEIKVNDSKLSALGERYLMRSSWPLVGSYAHAFWSLSEKIERAGGLPVAKRMWEMLVDKASPDASVRRFALSRLDTGKTEFEGLWDN